MYCLLPSCVHIRTFLLRPARGDDADVGHLAPGAGGGGHLVIMSVNVVIQVY